MAVITTKITIITIKMTVFTSKMTVISSKMTVFSTKVTVGQSERSRKIVNGLLSQSRWSWVKVDGHSSKSKRFFG